MITTLIEMTHETSADLELTDRSASAYSLLATMQLSDTALPIGRFVHSGGAESWLYSHPNATVTEVAELTVAAVSEGVATLDAVVLAHAHRAREIDSLVDLDWLLSAHKLSPTIRAASRGCGRQLVALGARLKPADALLTALAAAVKGRRTDGNLAIVSGALSRAMGIRERDAVLIELRGAATTILSAAVRLGRLEPTQSQTIMSDIAPSLVIAADRACAMGLAELSATTPELEIAALAHLRREVRLFSS